MKYNKAKENMRTEVRKLLIEMREVGENLVGSISMIENEVFQTTLDNSRS